MLGAISDRVWGIGYVLGDLAFALMRFLRAVGRGAADSWTSLPIITRRRLVAAVGAVALAFAFGALLIPNLPCSFPGGDECAPDDDAIDLAPAGALAYLHMNLDPDTDQAQTAAEVGGRVPMVASQVVGQVTQQLSLGAPVAASSQGWFGGEAAAVILASNGETVTLIETDDADAAVQYAESIASGVPDKGTYRDTEISEDERGAASAVVGDFLVLGTGEGVREVVDVATDAEGAESLADDPVATEALEALPEHRFAEAYLAKDGLDILVTAGKGTLSTLEPLVDAGAARGAAASVSASDNGFAFATRSVLDPERSKVEPGFFAAFDEFEPELPSELPPDSLAYLGLGQPKDTIDALLRQATVRAPGIAAGFADLLETLQGSAQVDVQRDFVEALGGEAAFAVVPRPARSGEEQDDDEDAGVITLSPSENATPYLEFLGDDVDEERAREALAKLQGPIARAVDPDLGAPVFDERDFGDLEAQILRISPVAQILYATYRSKLVIANDPAALDWLAIEHDDGNLEESDRYSETVEELPDEPALLAYMDVRGLLAFAEGSGLGEDPAYATFAPDLGRLASIGLTVNRDDDVLAADARVLVD